MNPPTINGVKGAFEQPIRFGYNDSGPYTIRSWRGDFAAISQLVPQLNAAGGLWEIKDTHTHTNVELECRFASEPGQNPDVEVPVDEWEFFAQKIEKDILESDIALVSNLSNQDKQNIRNAIQDPGSLQDFQNPTFEQTTEGTLVYSLMVAGVKSVRVNAPTLRHTMTVSNSYPVKATLDRVGKIIPTASMASLEGIPASVLFILPDDTSTRINGEGNYTGPTLRYGWYKNHPTVRGGPYHKSQIEQEWEYGLWPVDIYSFV